jgi:hypothetical protein
MNNSELTTVWRRLSISSLRDSETVHRAAAILAALPGVIEAKPVSSEKRIRVRYDVAKLQYPNLIHALEDVGLLQEPTWWERVKRGWYNDQDCITRDNAWAKPSPCCSNPTSIMAQSRNKRLR